MSSNRRKFLKQLSGTAAFLSAASLKNLASHEQEERRILAWEKKYSSNDKVRLAGIGIGIQGYNDMNAALKVPGAEIVACCDLYTGRLEHAKELYGDHIFTTKRYEEILDRKDVERVSSLGFAKAKEIYEAGDIGMINSVEAVNNRQSALGAWEYTIPLDASPQTIDWERYELPIKEKHSYEDKRFFWWRNYREYGTGMAGDLFVHLLSGLHFITSSKGPSKIYSIADLTYWKDGRNVPDVMTSILEYPQSMEHPRFDLTLRVNFVSGEGETGYTKITGSEGVMMVNENKVTVKRRKMSKAPGIGGWDSMHTFTNAMQQKLLDTYNKKYSKEEQQVQVLPDIAFAAPEGYSDHVAHLTNFIDSVRTGKTVVEDPVFGLRAAAPCLACNESYFQNKVIHWDGENMKLV